LTLRNLRAGAEVAQPHELLTLKSQKSTPSSDPARNIGSTLLEININPEHVIAILLRA